jgi:hypothetical protein
MTDKIEWGGTPGPWNFMVGGWQAFINAPDAGWFQLASVIVEVEEQHGLESSPEGETNARAIAEVPAMVQALRGLISGLEQRFPGSDLGQSLYFADAVKARAILARIDGGGK